MTGRLIGAALLLFILTAQTYFGCPPLHAKQAAHRVTIATCVVEAEDQTRNNRGEVAYYLCGLRASFLMVVGSSGELHLRELVGRTVDVQMEVVK